MRSRIARRRARCSIRAIIRKRCAVRSTKADTGELVARRDAARNEGRLYGIGFAAIVEPSRIEHGLHHHRDARRAHAGKPGRRTARSRVRPSASICSVAWSVTIASTPAGQGHMTVLRASRCRCARARSEGHRRQRRIRYAQGRLVRSRRAIIRAASRARWRARCISPRRACATSSRASPQRSSTCARRRRALRRRARLRRTMPKTARCRLRARRAMRRTGRPHCCPRAKSRACAKPCSGRRRTWTRPTNRTASIHRLRYGFVVRHVRRRSGSRDGTRAHRPICDHARRRHASSIPALADGQIRGALRARRRRGADGGVPLRRRTAASSPARSPTT